MAIITDQAYRQRTTYSHRLHRYDDGSWVGVIVTPHGLVVAYSDVEFNTLRLTYVRDGVSYERWIERARTPRGAAIMAGKFVQEIVNNINHSNDKEIHNV
jgi:hypothetical protein